LTKGFIFRQKRRTDDLSKTGGEKKIGYATNGMKKKRGKEQLAKRYE